MLAVGGISHLAHCARPRARPSRPAASSPSVHSRAKNIARPVEAFVLRLDPGAARYPQLGNVRRHGEAGQLQPREQGFVREQFCWRQSPGLLLCGALGVGWWLYRGTVAPKASEETLASVLTPTSPPATKQAIAPLEVSFAKAPRFSIVVLPFENLSDAEGGLPWPTASQMM